MGISFQEKSLWLMLVSLLGCFGFYAFVVMQTLSVPETTVDIMPQHVILFGVVVGMLVVTQVVGHVVIALVDRKTQTDERDRWIALKGTRNGAYTLATGAFFALTAAMLHKGNFVCTHVLLGFWVVAQLMEIASQLYYYRRGA